MKHESPVLLAVLPSKIPSEPTGLAAKRLERILDRCLIPAAVSCGMALARLDTSVHHDIAERRVLDQILLSDIVVFDLTFPDPATAYLLGTRRAFHPTSNLLLRAADAPTSLRVAFDCAVEYKTAASADQLEEDSASNLERKLRDAILAIKGSDVSTVGDYTLYELVSEYRSQELSRLKTDQFRERVHYSASLKSRLAEARKLEQLEAVKRLHVLETQLSPLQYSDSAVLIDLFLSYRSVAAWAEMIRLYESLPPTLKRSTMLREQLAMAKNRLGDRQEALAILEEIESCQGPSSETCALIGRVYKDLWQDSLETGDVRSADSYLSLAVASYCRGFEADWRDAYPGINAVTLLDIQGTQETIRLRDRLLPVVRFAVQQRLKNKQPDYWDYATLLELAVIENDHGSSVACLRDALRLKNESWGPETTANNLRILERFRRQRGQETGWLKNLIAELTKS